MEFPGYGSECEGRLKDSWEGGFASKKNPQDPKPGEKRSLSLSIESKEKRGRERFAFSGR